MIRIVFLDYLRILSIFLVICQHYRFFFNYKIKVSEHFIYSIGNLGVSIFLLISGFIIANIINKYRNIKDFLIARFLRIYPLFFLAFLLYFFFLESNSTSIFINIILQLILPIGDLSKSYTLTAVEWTLRVEFLFYIVLAILFYSNNLSIFKIFLLQIFNVIFLFFYHNYSKSNPYICLTLANLNYVLIGSIIYLYFNDNCKKILNLTILIASIFITYLIFIKIYNNDFIIYFSGIIGLIIFLLSFVFRDYFKNFKIIKIFSDLTFPFYLFHQFFNNLIFKNNFYNIIVAILFSYLVHKMIEEKIANFKNKIIKKI